MAKFWAYGRHSTDKQGITQEVQEQQLRRYYEFTLKPKGVVWGGFLYDAAQSAKKPLTERPKGRELLVLAQPGDHVGWAKLDRAFRSVRDGATTMPMFKDKGVSIHSLDLQLDTSTPMGACILHVMLAFAELERGATSVRTAEVTARLRETEQVYTSSSPIGWKYARTATSCRLVPDPDERDMVEQLWHRWDNGEAIESLQLDLLKRGVKRMGRNWSNKTIKRAFVARIDGYPKKIVDGKRFNSGHIIRAAC